MKKYIYNADVSPNEHPDIPYVCYNCGINTKPLFCAGCRHIVYCSKECQKKDWKKHKPNCGTVMDEYFDYEKVIDEKPLKRGTMQVIIERLIKWCPEGYILVVDLPNASMDCYYLRLSTLTKITKEVNKIYASTVVKNRDNNFMLGSLVKDGLLMNITGNDDGGYINTNDISSITTKDDSNSIKVKDISSIRAKDHDISNTKDSNSIRVNEDDISNIKDSNPTMTKDISSTRAKDDDISNTKDNNTINKKDSLIVNSNLFGNNAVKSPGSSNAIDIFNNILNKSSSSQTNLTTNTQPMNETINDEIKTQLNLKKKPKQLKLQEEKTNIKELKSDKYNILIKDVQGIKITNCDPSNLTKGQRKGILGLDRDMIPKEFFECKKGISFSKYEWQRGGLSIGTVPINENVHRMFASGLTTD